MNKEEIKYFVEYSGKRYVFGYSICPFIFGELIDNEVPIENIEEYVNLVTRLYISDEDGRTPVPELVEYVVQNYDYILETNDDRTILLDFYDSMIY